MVTSSAAGFIMKPLWHQKEKVSIHDIFSEGYV